VLLPSPWLVLGGPKEMLMDSPSGSLLSGGQCMCGRCRLRSGSWALLSQSDGLASSLLSSVFGAAPLAAFSSAYAELGARESWRDVLEEAAGSSATVNASLLLPVALPDVGWR